MYKRIYTPYIDTKNICSNIHKTITVFWRASESSKVLFHPELMVHASCKKNTQFQGCSTNPNNPGSSKLAMLRTQKNTRCYTGSNQRHSFHWTMSEYGSGNKHLFRLVKGISDSPIFQRNTSTVKWEDFMVEDI